jgi:nucleotide-binding universal stress UspA family protein
VTSAGVGVNPLMFNKIAVGTDGSDTADKAVEVALDLAEHYRALLLVFSVYEPVSPGRLAEERLEAPDDIQWSISPSEDVDATLANVEERAVARGLRATSVVREGEPGVVVCELAEEHEADLLVIGNKGMQRRLFGSVPKYISQHAPCSVVIAKTT